MSLSRKLGCAALGLLCAFNLYATDITVTTKYGDVVVPDQPKRIVTVYEGGLDSAFALGFKPVGAISTRGGDGVASYIQEIAKDVPLVGSMRELNIEAVVAQRPDVILAPYYMSKEQYALLSKIAPTLVPLENSIEPDTWIKEFRFYAKALNREEAAEEILANIDNRIETMKKMVEAKIPADQRGASLLRWMPQGAVILTPKFFSNAILAQTGFDVTDAGLVEGRRPHSSPLSLENLPSIDNDWIFMATLDEEARDALAAAEKSPAFSRLEVAKKGHVIPVHGQLWTSATGPIAAQAILDDIQSVLDHKLHH